jgi:RNA polymerase sigma-70 factor (ECF subfamily)
LTRLETIAGTLQEERPGLVERTGNLYLAHREEIRRFLTGQGLPPATAQDITQDVFLQLLVSLRDGVVIRSAKAWLYRAAANRAVDYWRRERRFIKVELDAGTELAETLESPEMHLEQRAAQDQRMRRLGLEIQRLPKEHRLCVLLRSQGMRYREIAEILGVGVSTTAEWLDAALTRLRRATHE